MPFIVFFFLTMLTIYIPLPTILLLFQRLAEHHDHGAMISKILLLFFTMIDWFTSYCLLYKIKLKNFCYCYLFMINSIEFLSHTYLLERFHRIGLAVIWCFQLLCLICMLIFPLSKKFRRRVFASSFYDDPCSLEE